ncbi:hypothetical protein M427DRAFT_41837 [Gonapodya prolifera JEL478]|uniref:C2H2-type domain-containing protein n=1 Tax=Gonapodya prolifera (strain JEL478) TaxID=1344416 RepID=A0A139ASH0_GONPJ|nr:hypothetical protein M427DRAFT_41837 [Gonapodya prolifera JEL478]|eukprot:KXS19493.1 hypothetical protein M427DRAFT_41837 [Gonapodya prolifera JEL478]
MHIVNHFGEAQSLALCLSSTLFRPVHHPWLFSHLWAPQWKTQTIGAKKTWRTSKNAPLSAKMPGKIKLFECEKCSKGYEPRKLLDKHFNAKHIADTQQPGRNSTAGDPVCKFHGSVKSTQDEDDDPNLFIGSMEGTWSARVSSAKNLFVKDTVLNFILKSLEVGTVLLDRMYFPPFFLAYFCTQSFILWWVKNTSATLSQFLHPVATSIEQDSSAGPVVHLHQSSQKALHCLAITLGEEHQEKRCHFQSIAHIKMGITSEDL